MYDIMIYKNGYDNNICSYIKICDENDMFELFL